MQNHPETDNPHTKTILIVEDEPDIRNIMLHYLQTETSYQILTAADEFTALKIVQSIAPHLFLVDYHLGNMTGLQLVGHLRGMKEHEQTPIILMSAHMPEEASEQPDLHILHKPFELDRLADLFASILL